MFWTYLQENGDQVIKLTAEHIELTAMALFFAIAIGVPTGILISRKKYLARPVIGVANVLQAIPSMALLGFAIPLLGIGSTPAIVVVILYTLLPIIKNTATGLSGISPDMMEAARGIGMRDREIMRRVQLPLALPVIMTGVRVAAVTAVGLMTIAAFIGAGGLGYLVFSGIRTVNNAQILAGAIPACILALLVDYIGGAVEFLLTPSGTNEEYTKNREAFFKKRKRKKFGLIPATIVIVAVFVHSFSGWGGGGDRRVAIGTKDFTEAEILGHILAEVIEDRTDITVDRKVNLGGTQVVFSALKKGEVDLTVDYTGTAYGDILGYPTNTDAQEVYRTVVDEYKDKFRLAVLEPMNFQNAYALAVEGKTAEKFGLTTISDYAARADELRLGCTLEFLNREDGIPGLEKTYSFTAKDPVGIDGSNRYVALINGETQVTDVFTTDALLKKYDLTVLEDDRHHFPPYYAIPVVREDTLEKYPELKSILEEVGRQLDEETMIALNYRVDENHERPRDVAHSFLQEKGLIGK